MAAASFDQLKQEQFFSRWLILFQYFKQYYLNRKLLSTQLSRNTAKLDFLMNCKLSKKIFFGKRNSQVLHIFIDLQTKQPETLTHTKSPELTSLKARQSYIEISQL